MPATIANQSRMPLPTDELFDGKEIFVDSMV